MSALIDTLTRRFDQGIVAAFGDEHAGTPPVLRRSNRADFQADVALGLGRKLGRPPREIAEALVAKLDLAGLVEKVEIAGPGFVNLTLTGEWLAREVASAAADPRLGVASEAPETVVIDYSSPNVAKEMHVGHIRSTLIGDALARVLEHVGHRVIRQNHLGDWGTPFGMLIEHVLDTSGGDATSLSIRDLDVFYREARAKFDGDPAFAERSRRRVVLLQGGDPKTLELWRLLVELSTTYFEHIYERLGVGLRRRDVCSESFYNPMLAKVTDDLRAAGLLEESDGAECVFAPGFTSKEGKPLPLIVRKTDGGFGYAATDLAGVRHRTATLGATRLLYVVGAPQQQHLAMVFAVAAKAGWLVPPARATHVAFGSILGPDKKMFKTREGGTVKLADLLDEAIARARAILEEKDPPHLDEAARREVARMIGIGALKYVDLSSDRVKDYVFDWNRMLAFDGNTAPYLQFAHARTRSILRKAGEAGVASGAVAVRTPEERALALALLGFGDAVAGVAESLQPHRLCTYLFDLATATTSFLENCPVLKAEDDAARASRLALSDVAGKVLARGLALLGIEAPEAM
ncbi:MAG: arginine--tRNA ligase [Labilithrix sp.]|nr:arginine--tRNA ligase [Labilithrix sp.]MCW5836429.1 arginine--tRNA ligase [Labilithrix sp.]